MTTHESTSGWKHLMLTMKVCQEGHGVLLTMTQFEVAFSPRFPTDPQWTSALKEIRETEDP
jgi:DNA-binding sugar fermentation-stimulating protein